MYLQMKRLSATFKLSVHTIYCRTNRHISCLHLRRLSSHGGQWECQVMGMIVLASDDSLNGPGYLQL